jgi:DNA polymerase III epsilon subunit-like protein
VQWHIYLSNSIGYPIDVLVAHNVAHDRSPLVTRNDYFGINPLRIMPDSSHDIVLDVSVFDFCSEPKVEDPNDFSFGISVDSNHIRIDSLQLNLFPFPENKNHILCDCYTYVDSSGTYSCSLEYFDTIDVFSDTILATIKSFYWRRFIL